MTLDIQYIHMPTSDAMSGIVTKKLEKLQKKYSWLLRADVFFKKQIDPTGKGRICEIKLNGPGFVIFATSDEDDFEKAVAATINDLKRQLSKRKEILNRH